MSLARSRPGLNRVSHRSPLAAALAALIAASGTSSAGRSSSGSTKLKTTSLSTAVERTSFSVRSKASSLRYWLTPGGERGGGTGEGGGAADGRSGGGVLW